MQLIEAFNLISRWVALFRNSQDRVCLFKDFFIYNKFKASVIYSTQQSANMKIEDIGGRSCSSILIELLKYCTNPPEPSLYEEYTSSFSII